MMSNNASLEKVVKSNLCIGCGLCTVDAKIGGMVFRRGNDCMTPRLLLDNADDLGCKICPGKGYPIVAEGKGYYGGGEYNPNLGFYDYLFAVHSNDPKVMQNASSGGAISQILLYLLSRKIVDKVSVTQFFCDENGVHTRSFLTDDPQEVLKAQGSKYCPVDLSGLVGELKIYEGRVAIMATPCAIAGIRNIQKTAPQEIKADIIFTIANFCGGHKSFKNIKRLADIYGINYYRLDSFRFRGDGQPGSLRFIEKSGKTAYAPYPKYVGMNGYKKMHRCFVCPDATGELADFSCGDAWIPRFQDDASPWSVIISRNHIATEVVRRMIVDGDFTMDNISDEEVVLSQKINLKSKKARQKARMNLYRSLGLGVPEFDGGYCEEQTSMRLEFKVFLKHKILEYAENIGIYKSLHGILKRR